MVLAHLTRGGATAGWGSAGDPQRHLDTALEARRHQRHVPTALRRRQVTSVVMVTTSSVPLFHIQNLVFELLLPWLRLDGFCSFLKFLSQILDSVLLLACFPRFPTGETNHNLSCSVRDGQQGAHVRAGVIMSLIPETAKGRARTCTQLIVTVHKRRRV